MARIRSIKPEFFTSLTIAELQLSARLTFIGLWTHVDDDGRCRDDARLIKAALWPLDDCTAADVEEDLKALTESSLILRYEVNGRRYLAVRGWREHQVVNRRTASKLPPPSERSVTGQTAGDAGATSANESFGAAHDGLSESAVSTHDRKGTGNREQGNGTGKGNREKEGLFDAPTAAEGKSPDTQLAEGEYTPEFEAWWLIYPRHEGKKPAFAKWKAALKKTSAERLAAAARSYADAKRGSEPQFLKLATTWLNGEHWNDELVATGATTSKPGGAFHNPANPDDYYANMESAP